MSFIYFLFLALVAVVSTASAEAVFAHFIVGNVKSYTVDHWKKDIQLAADAGIDGFVLNIATPWDGPIAAQVGNAFQAATDIGSKFKLLFSFDYLGGAGPWPSSDIIEILQGYGSHPAHYKHNNKPLVSTFEGVANANDWPAIHASVPGGISFLPDWTSLGPGGFAAHLDKVDGAFSWDMWPEGPNSMSTTKDKAWQSTLGSKAYMMGVSPWFFTNLPGYGKAWTWRGDDLWHQRWQQVLEVKPAFVQIVTWNDYGESHYIGPIFDDGIPRGGNTNAHPYVDNMPHDHWRDILPYYIAQYKNGGAPPAVSNDKLSYWYRLTPAAAGSTSGVTGNTCAFQRCYNPSEIVQDKVFVTTLVKSRATLKIQIGANPPSAFELLGAGVHHFSTPFSGQTGAVTIWIERDSKPVVSSTGKQISARPENGVTNFNAWVGGASN
ncbi:Glucan endo-1,3-alpha-glucosidase agn1 [Coniosporium apollinis]|uniref:Glucan endo-1,3-alpha-glucosidase agn1 n=1 Tax=Coniosporium apollinis TaxID=61459 RepID=A0ABQ9P3W6_9PEZI|nr:Glucan endo-1,3-alpha-glucosidase agn1 [Coniosporium apollinis]